jgi:hypothetical protein
MDWNAGFRMFYFSDFQIFRNQIFRLAMVRWSVVNKYTYWNLERVFIRPEFTVQWIGKQDLEMFYWSDFQIWLGY